MRLVIGEDQARLRQGVVIVDAGFDVVAEAGDAPDPPGSRTSRWSPTPFPGSICQLVSATDNSAYPPLERRLFGRERDYGGQGVHAPN